MRKETSMKTEPPERTSLHSFDLGTKYFIELKNKIKPKENIRNKQKMPNIHEIFQNVEKEEKHIF